MINRSATTVMLANFSQPATDSCFSMTHPPRRGSEMCIPAAFSAGVPQKPQSLAVAKPLIVDKPACRHKVAHPALLVHLAL
jgi:hypothetical protein